MSMIKEGMKYYHEGRIRHVHIGDNLVSFLIQGDTGVHTVIFDLKLKKVSCSCWGFTVHKKCKHIVCALAYLKDHNKQIFEKIYRELNLKQYGFLI